MTKTVGYCVRGVCRTKNFKLNSIPLGGKQKECCRLCKNTMEPTRVIYSATEYGVDYTMPNSQTTVFNE